MQVPQKVQRPYSCFHPLPWPPEVPNALLKAPGTYQELRLGHPCSWKTHERQMLALGKTCGDGLQEVAVYPTAALLKQKMSLGARIVARTLVSHHDEGLLSTLHNLCMPTTL